MANQSQFLACILKQVVLWHDADGNAYASVDRCGYSEHVAVESPSFRSFITGEFGEFYASSLEDGSRVPGIARPVIVTELLQTLAAIAVRSGQERRPAIRLAEADGAIWIDLCDASRRAVKVTSEGWNVVANPAIPFLRMKGMEALPEPVSGGTTDDLRPFLNVESDRDLTLIIAWLVAALRPRGPYPLLVLSGQQGSAKSTTARVLQRLIDPNVAPARAAPKNEQDLLIAATRGRVVCFDNISTLTPSLSDALCRLATGGAFSTRRLFTDAEEILLEAQRPAILNGIPTLVSRPDLVERSISITLPRLPSERRRTEKEFWSNFEAVGGRIMGALLDGVSRALANVDTIKLGRPPRMADFAAWVTAAEEGLGWRPGCFLSAYEANAEEANDDLLEDDPLASAVIRLSSVEQWSGTGTELLGKLQAYAHDSVTRVPHWPKDATRLSSALRRLQPSLSKTGCELSFERREGRDRRRIISIRKIERAIREAPSHRTAAGSAIEARVTGSSAVDTSAKTSPAKEPVGVFALPPHQPRKTVPATVEVKGEAAE